MMKKIKFKDIKVGDCIIEEQLEERNGSGKRYLICEIKTIEKRRGHITTDCFLWLDKKFKLEEYFGQGHTGFGDGIRKDNLYILNDKEKALYYTINIVIGNLDGKKRRWD